MAVINVVGPAAVEQAARRLVQGVQRVGGDGAPGEVQPAGQLSQRRDLVGLAGNLELSQHQAAALLHGRDQHAAAVRGLLRCATDILAVHADRRHAPRPTAALAVLPGRLLRVRIRLIRRDLPAPLALQPGPLPHRAFQGLWRQGGEDVVERRDRRGGVALPAGAVETAHRLPLRLAQQAGELREGRHAAVAGQPRGDRQHEHGAQAVALAPRMAVLRHCVEELEQAVQLRRVRGRAAGRALPGGLVGGLAQGRVGVGLQFEHQNLPGLAVTAPRRRSARLARIAAAEAQMTAPARAPLTAAQLRRKACVYVRQSSDFQVRHHVERQRLQYALADHVRQLGFRDVEVIDEDQGTSGDGVLRTGFDRLVSAVCRGEVGLVLSLEASCLARNGREWHTLLDFCAIVGCLVGDRRCLYDPAAADDRLFLGMKGNFAEAELALFRQRSQESLLALAQRGELFLHLPAGYEKVGKRRIEMTPDQRQRDALGVVFRKFTELRSVRQVWLWSRREQCEIPVRPPGQGIVWKVPTETGLYALLHNPIYAGAYAYGRRCQETSIENGRKRVRSGILKSGPEEWTVLLRDRHEAYITWEQYERNQA